jgi:hypothetical protein
MWMTVPHLHGFVVGPRRTITGFGFGGSGSGIRTSPAAIAARIAAGNAAIICRGVSGSETLDGSLTSPLLTAD